MVRGVDEFDFCAVEVRVGGMGMDGRLVVWVDGHGDRVGGQELA